MLHEASRRRRLALPTPDLLGETLGRTCLLSCLWPVRCPAAEGAGSTVPTGVDEVSVEVGAEPEESDLRSEQFWGSSQSVTRYRH